MNNDLPDNSIISPVETSEKALFMYHGDGLSLAKLMLKNLFLTVITLGIYMPWARTNNRKFFWSNTSFKDDRFSYTGTGEELFKGFVKLFAIIFCGVIVVQIILAFFPAKAQVLSGLLMLPIYIYIFSLAGYSGLKYRALRTLWRQIRFDVFRTKELTREFLYLYIKGSIFSGLTFGLYLPYFTMAKNDFLINKASYGNGVKFSFDGVGSDYFSICIKGFFLSVITFGIYTPWYFIARMKYRLNHTHVDKATFDIEVPGSDFFIYSVVGYIFTTMTLGLASPWVINRIFKLFIDNISLNGALDLTSATLVEQSESAFGDDVATSYDIDLGF